MLEPEVAKGLATAVAITVALVVFLAFNEAVVEILSPRYSAVRDGNPSTIGRRSADDGSES